MNILHEAPSTQRQVQQMKQTKENRENTTKEETKEDMTPKKRQKINI